MKDVFNILGENVSDEEVNSKSKQIKSHIQLLKTHNGIIAMIKIAGVKSNDKINFKEFVDFFYKID